MTEAVHGLKLFRTSGDFSVEKDRFCDIMELIKDVEVFMRSVENKYKCVPFWSWNDELDERALVEQINWMYENGVGGFFMHARGGL